MVKIFAEYLKQAITRWYMNAERDYGITGRFVSCVVDADGIMVLTWEEDGRTYRTRYRWFETCSPEQVFSMWMDEDPENVEEVA